MKKSICMSVMVALLLGASALQPAQGQDSEDWKPVIVASCSGYDEVVGDLDLIGKMIGQPYLRIQTQVAVKLLTLGQGLLGLDNSRRWGMVVQTDGSEIRSYAFLPAADPEKLLKIAKLFASKEEIGDGLLKIPTKEKPLFLKAQDDWIFLSDNCDLLAGSLPDPQSLLADSHQAYDLAVLVTARNVPDKCRQKAIAKFKADAAKKWKRFPGETDQEFKVRTEIGKRLLQGVVDAANDLDQVVFGVTLDGDNQKALVDVTASAVEGTPTAARFARVARSKSQFAGCRVPEATLSGSWVGDLGAPKPEELQVLVDTMRDRWFMEIDKKHPAGEARVAKELSAGMLKVIQDSMAAGRIEGGITLFAQPESATLVEAGYVSSGDDLERALGKIVDAVRQKHPEDVARVLTENSGECRGVRFHTLSFPIPEDAKDREKAVRLVGENLEVVVGIGQRAAYLSMGRNATESLEQMIERSAAAGDSEISPVELSVALAQYAQLVADVGKEQDRAKAAKVVDLLKGSAEEDRCTMTVDSVEGGVKLSFELEEGALELMGAAHKAKKRR